MVAAAAARRQLSVISINLWQTGLRSLFRYFMFRTGLTQDEAWAAVRVEIEKNVLPDTEEWEYQEVRAIIYEEENMTIEIAERMYDKYPRSTPLLDAIKTCIANSEMFVDKSE